MLLSNDKPVKSCKIFLMILVTIFLTACTQDSGNNDSGSMTIPNAPGGLSPEVISNSQIKLTWSDNSGNEAGFRIERAPDNGGHAGAYAEISAISANNASYTDSGLENETAYYYRIRAYNVLGNSDYSNEAKIITPPFYLKAYYVNFEGGDDLKDGTAEEKAWKHAPGDPKAEGIPATIALQPGDMILFKGGVQYRGSITVNAGGTSVNPIIFKGDGWGSEKAILEGSEVLSGWTQCAFADDCGGNANYANIYYTYIQPDIMPDSLACTAFTVNLHENNEFCWLAQSPDLPDPFYRDQISYFYTLPAGIMQTTSLSDPDIFNQSESDYWDGSSVMLWITPNIVVTRAIKSFIPATNTITYDDVEGGGVYTDRGTYYSIINSIHALDKPGEYYFNSVPEADGSHKVYLWPNDTGNLNNKIEVSVRNYGINISNNSNLVIEGFTVQKYSGGGLTDCGIGSVTAASTSKAYITVRNNYIRHNSHTSGGYGGVYLSHCDNSIIEDNVIEENVLTTGLCVTASDRAITRGNIIRRPGHTGMWYFGNTNSQIVNNTVNEVYGTHGNGITCYLSCKNILIAWNKLFEAGSGFTLQASANMYFYRNLVDANDGDSNVNEWGGTAPAGGGVIAFLNNIFVRNNRNASLNMGGTTGCTYVVKNNIIDGGGTGNRSHNIYAGLLWNQEPGYGWYPAEGEIIQTDLNMIFADPDNGDFHLKAGSPAIDTGTDISAYLPIDIFPEVDFNRDVDGNYAPVNCLYDIGAYEY
ncbi:MAG: right-handed parallel beta-helix repeat-containing protein [Spirochaetota bacterium]